MPNPTKQLILCLMLMLALSAGVWAVESQSFTPPQPPIVPEGEVIEDIEILIKNISGHSDSVGTVSFSPDGKTIASGSNDKTVQLWDLASGKKIWRKEGHDKAVSSVSFSPDGKTIASGSSDNTIRLRNTENGKEIRCIEGNIGMTASVRFSPDGKTIAFGSGNTIQLWDTNISKEIRHMKGHTKFVLSVSFSPDGKTITSGSQDNTLRLWNVSSGEEIRRMEGHSDYISSVCFSPDGKMIASASGDKTVRLWDAASGKEIQRMEGHTKSVSSVSFSPDGKTIASGSQDNTVRLWDVPSGEEIRRMEGHTEYIWSVSFSPDGKFIASGSGLLSSTTRTDNTVRLWDAGTGREIRHMAGHSLGYLPISYVYNREKNIICESDHSSSDRASDKAVTGFVISENEKNYLLWNIKENRVWRYDDGTFLPALPPQPEQKGIAQILFKPEVLYTDDGEATEFSMKIRNTGKGKLFWINPIQDIQPNNPLVFHPPQTKVVLQPDETIELPCKVSAKIRIY